MPVRQCSQWAHDRKPLFQPASIVELAEQHEELVGGGMEPRGQRGDLLAKRVGGRGCRGSNRSRPDLGDRCWDESGGRHPPSSHRSFCRIPEAAGGSNALRSTFGLGPSHDCARQARLCVRRQVLHRDPDIPQLGPENVSSPIFSAGRHLHRPTGCGISNRHATPHPIARAPGGCRHVPAGRAPTPRLGREPGDARRLPYAVRERLGRSCGCAIRPTARCRCTAIRPRSRPTSTSASHRRAFHPPGHPHARRHAAADDAWRIPGVARWRRDPHRREPRADCQRLPAGRVQDRPWPAPRRRSIAIVDHWAPRPGRPPTSGSRTRRCASRA